MSDGAQLQLTGCRRGCRLWVLLVVVLCSVFRPWTEAVSDADIWQQLQSQEATVSLAGLSWRWLGDKSVLLDTAVTITGPGSITIDTLNTFITGSGRLAALSFRDVTFLFKSSILNYIGGAAYPNSFGPIPAINGSSLNLTFVNVTVVAPFRTLASTLSFWTAADLLAALQPQLPGGLGSDKQQLLSYSSPATDSSSGSRTLITNMVLLPTDQRPAAADCFMGGIPVGDSYSLRSAMNRTDVTTVFLYRDIVLMPSEFNYSHPVVLSGGRSLELYGCPNTTTTINTNYNWTRFSVQVAGGGFLSLRGLTFTDAPLLNQLFWPRNFVPLLGWVHVGIGGGCAISDAAIISPDGSDLRAYMATISSNSTTAARPVYSARNSSYVTIDSWDMTGADMWQPSPGVSTAAAASSFWRLRDVTVVSRPPGTCVSSSGSLGVNVDSGPGFRDLIRDPLIPAIRVVGDIQLLASEWPPEASGPAGGQIFVNVTKEVYACHPTPGQRYIMDFGNLGQVVFVFGTLSFRGSLLMTHPRPSPRRSWLYLLIGALSVETDGVIQFDGVEIRGNTSSPFTNAADPFWNYLSDCGSYCDGFIPPSRSYLNVSFYDAFIFQYRFNKTAWVAVSQNRTIQGSGYWGYTDVALTWRPDSQDGGGGGGAGGKETPVAAIAAPVVIGGAALIAGIVGIVVWLRRRHAASAAAAPAAPYRQKSEASTSARGNALEPGGPGGGSAAPDSNDGGGGGAGVGGGSSPPQGSSSANNHPPTATATATFSHAATTSMMSASAPTEARIEDMRRVITSQAALTGSHRNEEITLLELLGEGTFGRVYRGTWRGTTVAVKTMVLPTNMSGKEKREKMAVMETAISSSLSHPNIVQTYTYAVIPVRGDGNQMDNKLRTGSSLTVDNSSPLATMSNMDMVNVHSWEVRLVLEYCDRGSLRDVLSAALLVAERAREGAAAERGRGVEPAESLPPGRPAALDQPSVPLAAAQQAANAPGGVPGGADLGREHCPLGYCEVLDTCLDVAKAMLHMHSENIVHGDLKARNILLKSGGMGDGRSYVAKVADFGLSLRIDPHETHVSNVYQGTITHMAPEVLLHGKVSKLSDVYAFAILMWETYTGGQAFKGTPRALLGHEVTKMNRRPQFPLDTPFEFQLLSCRCWESDPAIRPGFELIVSELTRMRAKAVTEQAARQMTTPQLGQVSLSSAGGGSGGPAAAAAAAATTAAAAAAPAAEPQPMPLGGTSMTFTTSTATLATVASGLPGYGIGVQLGGLNGVSKGREAAGILSGGAFNARDGFGGGGGGDGGGIFQSITLHSEMGNMTLPTTELAGQGLLVVQGVDGSTLAATQSEADAGLSVKPGAFTIGAWPPLPPSNPAGAGAGAPTARPAPAMPPILETLDPPAAAGPPPPPSPQHPLKQS